MWRIIIITVPDKKFSIIVEKKVKFLQKQGFFSKDTIISCIEDPDTSVGSGGATLNAILTAVELLSAKQNIVPNTEVLKNAYILIFHMGRHYSFDVGGKALCLFPIRNEATGQFLTNIEILYEIITKNIAPYSDSGVYVCSTDMVLSVPITEKVSIRNSSLCVLACPISNTSSKSIIFNHGVYDYNEIETKKFLKNIIFMPSAENLQSIQNENGNFALVSGIVYFSYEVTCILHNLSMIPPLSACTYHGEDNAETPINLSLFFDIINPCCENMKKSDYIEGLFKSNHGYNVNQNELLKKSRICLWNTLNTFKANLMMFSNNVKYIYFDSDTVSRQRDMLNELNLVKNFEKRFFIAENDFNYDILVFNTIFKRNTKVIIGKNSTILNCEFYNNSIHIGENCFLTDLKISNYNLIIPDNIFIQNVYINLGNDCSKIILIVLGIFDNIFKKIDHDDWSFMNLRWTDLQQKTKIEECNLWDDKIKRSDRTLFNAKLYGYFDENQYENSLQLLNLLNNNTFQLDTWRKFKRFSLEDIIILNDLDKLFEKRSIIKNKISIKTLIENICKNNLINFQKEIQYYILDGSTNQLLKSLDKAAIENKLDYITLPRIISFISGILLEMAGDLKILKPGNRSNFSWMKAFQFIENRETENAILEMARLRKEWSYRDDLLIRAARHYEGAMQCFIKMAVNSAYEFISFNKISKNINFDWIKSTCPARLDLAGAWSDTPPICYESKGSSVTNVAIMVNGQFPIGSQGRIIKKKDNKSYFIKVLMKQSTDESESDIKLIFNDVNDLKDYNKPLIVGCLIKATIIFSKLVDINSNETLDEQLEKKIGGSLEIHTWTNLPHGSGLGTSSILIGCVLSVIKTIMGINFTENDLIHSTLIIEQMMTTGGGYQDQCGGLLGGFKITKCMKNLPLKINPEIINFPEGFDEIINDRLLLIYTGVTRLAKDLLLNVVRNWYALKKEIWDNVEELVENSNRCAEAIHKGDIYQLGHCINIHRKNKSIMSPGSIPVEVLKLILEIEPLTLGMALAGAGGGGFLYVITKEPNMKSNIQDLIELKGLNMKIFDAKISKIGLKIEHS